MKKIKLILTIFLMLLIIAFLLFNNAKNKKNSTDNLAENAPFSISKIKIYSSAYGENQTTSFQQNSWILNLLQYSDIAIYIGNGEDDLNQANTAKTLSIDNIKISNPKTGNSKLYYLDTLNFGTPTISEKYQLENNFEFTVLNDKNEESTILSNTPVFFADCSNPITLKYVNDSVKKNFNLSSTEPVVFNGTLLKLANIELKNLSATIDFSLNIKNYKNETYTCNLSIPISLANETSTIYDGSILDEIDCSKFKFTKKP